MQITRHLLVLLAVASTTLAQSQYSQGPLSFGNGELTIPESELRSFAGQTGLPQSTYGSIVWSIGNLHPSNTINWLQQAQQIAVVHRVAVVEVVNVAVQIMKLIPASSQWHTVFQQIATCQGGQIGGQVISGQINGHGQMTVKLLLETLDPKLKGTSKLFLVRVVTKSEEKSSKAEVSSTRTVVFGRGTNKSSTPRLLNKLLEPSVFLQRLVAAFFILLAKFQWVSDIRSRCGTIAQTHNVPMIKIVRVARQCHRIIKRQPKVKVQRVVVLKTISTVFVRRVQHPKVVVIAQPVVPRIAHWCTLTQIEPTVWNSCVQVGLCLKAPGVDETNPPVEDLQTKTADVIDAIAENTDKLASASEASVLSWVTEFAQKNNIDPQVVSNIASHVSDLFLSQNKTEGSTFDAFGNVAVAKTEPVYAVSANSTEATSGPSATTLASVTSVGNVEVSKTTYSTYTAAPVATTTPEVSATSTTKAVPSQSISIVQSTNSGNLAAKSAGVTASLFLGVTLFVSALLV
ncbi:hypothetical protein BDR26DRAFT_874609 [Obelidium mucronatum]|nr:hypothetical protein BDR26DRAFT_874609 [Obelidium mucronatum]